MRLCSKCNTKKPITNFGRKGIGKDGELRYQVYCKECNKQYQREHYQSNKSAYKTKAKTYDKEHKINTMNFIRELTKDGCIICGENDLACLDFDHRDPKEKSHNISWMISQRYSLAKIKKEIEKCDILCANCHRKRTAKQFDWYKLP
jgi:hypothetical protein